MGYRSNVKLLIANKGFELLKKTCENSENEYVRDMITDCEIFKERKLDVLIGWTYVKWYSEYEDIKAVTDVLEKLTTMVEENPELLDDYYYKLIEIGEDDATREDTNDYDEEFTSEFYVERDFSL